MARRKKPISEMTLEEKMQVPGYATTVLGYPVSPKGATPNGGAKNRPKPQNASDRVNALCAEYADAKKAGNAIGSDQSPERFRSMCAGLSTADLERELDTADTLTPEDRALCVGSQILPSEIVRSALYDGPGDAA